VSGQQFEGFVHGGTETNVPAQFFVELFPHIDDEAELRVTLYAFYAIRRQTGEPRAIRASQLRTETPLMHALEHLGGEPALKAGLERAVRRGALLACPLEDGDGLYFINNHEGQAQLRRVRSGALEMPGATPRTGAPPARRARPAQVYEDEIGLLTPSVAEALAEAGERYPQEWIVDALRLAAKNNARSWRYAEAILRRWDVEGRDDATADGDLGDAARRHDDPYQHLIHR